MGVPQSDDPEEEAKQRQFTSLLNKLTVDNFDRILKRMVDIDVREARTLRGFVKKIFNKALVESIFAELYARLCKELLAALPRYESGTANFKRQHNYKVTLEISRVLARPGHWRW